MPALFDPLLAGDIQLPNRIVMAPMTRARAGVSHVPGPLLAEYYSQRASCGLIITEATMVAADGCAFTAEAGIFDEECVAGWRGVTEAVHSRGGRIMVQLWHPGRATHSWLNAGVQPISSTDRPIRDGSIRTPLGSAPYESPRRLALSEIPVVVRLFRDAAERALQAGFDGVQIHGAHGYLLDQFLRDGVNDRVDEFGGSIVNRARLLLEVIDAVIQITGPGRVAVRLSPLVTFNDAVDSDPVACVRYLARSFAERKLSFMELRHADFRQPAEQAIARAAREWFQGPLVVNGGYDFDSARMAVESGAADAVAFGTAFISNPDLVTRFVQGVALTAFNPTTLYTPGAQGYTDYAAATGT